MKRNPPVRRSPPRASQAVRVTVERGPYRGVSRLEMTRRICAMIDVLQLEDVEVSILITDDKRIHQLNKVYRHKDRPTDVLAFAMREGELAHLAGGVLGDVIVSVPTARKQARERGASLLEELTMLVGHGLLHLLGWDHETPAKDRTMRAETDRLCRAAQAAARASGAKQRSPKTAKTARRRSKDGAATALSRKRTAV